MEILTLTPEQELLLAIAKCVSANAIKGSYSLDQAIFKFEIEIRDRLKQKA